MAVNKKKIGKKIFYCDAVWTVEKIISPNKFDDYLLLSRKVKGMIHQDHKTIPVDLILIDAHNDTFYPYNKKTKKKVDLLLKKIKDDSKQRLEKALEQKWLDCFPEDI